MNDFTPFGWDAADGIPILRIESDKVGSGIKLCAMGADDEMANTMFSIEVDGSRVYSKRPEPMLIEYLQGMLEAEEYALSLNGKTPELILLTEEELRHIERVKNDVEDGLEDAPLGQ